MNEWRKRMSDAQTVQTETLETLTREYHQECTKAGDLKYRIECFQGDLTQCFDRMKKINQKAAKLKAQQALQAVESETSVATVDAPAEVSAPEVTQ